jgi:phenylpyruvate tautomerase PptA (4-oxalocrotonate tautomerase family)
MAQVKIYGQRDQLTANRSALSDAIHGCLVEAFGLPPEKRFQRFIGLDAADFIYPDDRSPRYTILEIVMFEGRSPEAKKRLIHLLYTRLESEVDIAPTDLEIVMLEAPRANWGIRGKPGDEIGLTYKVDV